MSLLYHLRTTLHTLRLRLSFMSDIHLNRLLAPYGEGSSTVDHTYAIDSLESMYINGNPRIHDCIISEIALWKMKAVPNHEFLMASVEYNGHVIGALHIERTVLPTENRSVNASSVSVASSSSSAQHFAHDPIIICSTDNVDHHTASAEMIAYHIPAGTSPLHVSSVVAACAVLNKAFPMYDIFKNQCYWYAGLAFRLLAGNGNVQRPKNTGQRAGEVAKFFSVMKEPKLDEHAKEFRPLYVEKLQAIEHEVTEKRRKDSDAADKADAERRAKEAERRADQSDRRAAELELELQKLKELYQGASATASQGLSTA
ncbi:hypothetical protein DAEQUDRAFT_811969 [Daedalea quercina L-15889]|uniref:Uncharacterized protein n=1 Tax=Daedalea quercina L-15889 TaxID=1314783 RepID=A0A165PX14_9APHY|nr:hypothetical protein DAEQUDRAFT_811969 [Daedalea quercina L-15889]